MKKTTKKLNTKRKNTISNTTKKERGGSIHQKWHQRRGKHQGRLKNTKKCTKKLKTAKKKTISNTTKKERGVDSLGAAPGTSIQHKRPQSELTLVATTCNVSSNLHKT
jgi:hypothetical protein